MMTTMANTSAWTRVTITVVANSYQDQQIANMICLFGAPRAFTPSHPLIREINKVEPWYYGLMYYRLGLSGNDGNKTQSEFLLPYKSGVPALRALFVLSPQIQPLITALVVRTVKGDDLWMSMNNGNKPMVAIQFSWVGNRARAVNHVLSQVEQVLAKFGARPHWGQHFTMNPRQFLKRSYPRLCDFRERKSFEDDSYDASTEELDYKDWDEGKWLKTNRPKFCSGAEKQQICNCDSNAGQSVLLCASQNLATTDAELPQNFTPTKFYRAKRPIQQISVDVFTPGLGKSLHHLYLDYNFITTLDEGVFGNLSKLKKLVLDGNREIQLLRGVFTNAFDVLEVLSLDKCGIKELDEDIFANLTSLRALSLSGNPLDRIPLALPPLHSLTHFAMSSTNLKELKEGAFQTTVPGMEKLYMRKMKYLWKIGTNAFTGLKKLKFLDFGYSTKLQLLEANVFGLDPPRNFSELNLQQCNLSTLSAEIMSPIYWKSMDVIKLEGNPFVCDCKLKWLLDMKNVMRTIYRTDEPTYSIRNFFNICKF
uniref:ALO domain-containing protein n=1 Tax=Globodera pallida TaxID=36090 RepID=A0A183CI28_GLOPA